MTLSERIAANECRVRECSEPRAPDAEVCSEHLTDLWMHRLTRRGDEYVVGLFEARDETGRLHHAA